MNLPSRRATQASGDFAKPEQERDPADHAGWKATLA
jgi:hypothetical protein